MRRLVYQKLSAATVGMMLVLASIANAVEPAKFSVACDQIRTEAVRTYWRETAEPNVATRVAQILRSPNSQEASLGLIGEVLAGRISVEQLSAGSLAGLDAVDKSAVCRESDRQSAAQFRAILPNVMQLLEKKVSEMGSSK